MAFDLDNFPTRRAAKEMMSMISPIYNRSYVAKWIFEVIGFAFSLAEDTVDEFQQEEFPATCTWTIDYWEDMYSIPHDYSLTLQQRRDNLCRRIYSRNPMNPARICQLVLERTGITIDIEENVDLNMFGIKVTGVNPESNFNDLFKIINELKQSHIGYRTTIVCDMGTAGLWTGCFVKRHIKRYSTSYTIEDPDSIGKWYTDEDDNMLLDENGTVILAE